MENDSQTVFKRYMETTFPPDGKRTRSAIIRETLARRITDYLKGGKQDDKAFRHFVKKAGFQLLDLPAVGIRDALVVRVTQKKEVRAYDVRGVLKKRGMLGISPSCV